MTSTLRWTGTKNKTGPDGILKEMLAIGSHKTSAISNNIRTSRNIKQETNQRQDAKQAYDACFALGTKIS